MPCSDNQAQANAMKDERALEEKFALYEKLLCSACSILDGHYSFDFSTNPLLNEWYSAHRVKDTAAIPHIIRNLLYMLEERDSELFKDKAEEFIEYIKRKVNEES